MRPAAAEWRVDALDGLRGLGAIVVVVRHTLNATAMSEATWRRILEGPLGLLLCGDGAVHMFFVLSGWVLAASLARGRGLAGAARFWIRRVFRIHPPYVVGVLFSWAAAFAYAASYAAMPTRPGLSEWLGRLGAVHLSFARILSFLGFPGHAGTQLPVGWTLAVEMSFSLLLPFLVLAARRGRGLPLVGAALAVLLAWPAAPVPKHALDFALGIAAFQERHALRRFVEGMHPALAAAALAAAVVLQAAPTVFGWSIPMVGILVTPNDARSHLLMSLGGWTLVLAALFRPGARRVFGARPLVAVGRSSYSLYLFHMPILLAAAPVLPAPVTLPAWLLLLAVVCAVSQLLAIAGWRLVERPSIAAGEALCARLRRGDG